MLDFTGLERAVIAAICEDHPQIAERLLSLVSGARVSERDNTGHGFYTSFEVEERVLPVEWAERFLNGPNAEIAVGDETLLMGFILWFEDGYPNCIEGFQYGDVDLKAVDLSTLRWRERRVDDDPTSAGRY